MIFQLNDGSEDGALSITFHFQGHAQQVLIMPAERVRRWGVRLRVRGEHAPNVSTWVTRLGISGKYRQIT